MNIKKTAKRIAMAILEEFAVDAVRGFMMEMLSNVTPEHVKEAIENWYTDLWSATPSFYRSRAKILARKFRRFKDRITLNLVLVWLRVDHPHLYRVIVTTPRGVEWLNECLEKVKRELWGEN